MQPGLRTRPEALDIAARVQQNRDERAKLASEKHLLRSERDSRRWSGAEWRAVLMQLSVFSIWILVPLSLASIPVLWLVRSCLRVTSGPFHSLLCLFADVCPAVLALASAVLFIAYAPVDSAYRQVLRGPFSPEGYAEVSRLVYAPLSLPEGVQTALLSISGPDRHFLLWSVATAILILLAVLPLIRQFRSRAESG